MWSKLKEGMLSFLGELMLEWPGILVLIAVIAILFASADFVDDLEEYCENNPTECDLPSKPSE